MRTAKLTLLTAALAISGLAGCDRQDTPLYSHFEEIPPSGWNPLDVLVFCPTPIDSNESPQSRFDLTMVVRYAARHKINALPIAVTVDDNNGTLHADTIILRPSHAEGTNKAVTRYGVTELRLPLYKDERLTDGYALTFESFSPESHTKGVMNIGVVIERK